MYRLLLLFLIISLPIVFCAFGGLVGRVQSTGVRGTLMCNGRPAPRVLIKLYDDDRGIDMDDFMGETKSDSQGNFELSGYIHEMSPIDPKINIYHDCNDGIKPCQRKISIMIPDGYITEAKIPRKWYDVGKIELAGKFAGETRDCIH
uniref:Transthyretin-like family protein n=1 Tax=Wuchereria bancrofti TaxID=6293 RepID=A0AAF5PQX0_WUCBA